MCGSCHLGLDWEGEILLSAFGSLVKKHKNCDIFHWIDIHK